MFSIVNSIAKYSSPLFIFLVYCSFNSVIAGEVIGCPKFYYAGIPPIVNSNLLKRNTYDLCFSGYAVKYSGVSKTSLYSASFLTANAVKAAYKLKRNNAFHEELTIPLEHRSLLSDYWGGNSLQRGHLAPSGDFDTYEKQYESFSLVNIQPQSAHSNQVEWRKIEEGLRAFVVRNNQSVYVITGTLYLGNKLRKVGNNVLVPSHIFKVVLFPNLNIAGAYVSVNDETGRYDYVSINQLQNVSGISFFPSSLDSEVFKYRFVLPLNSHEATQMKMIRIASDNNSQIFSMLPKFGDENLPPNPPLDLTDAQKHRSEVTSLAADSLKSNVSVVSDWVRRLLTK